MCEQVPSKYEPPNGRFACEDCDENAFDILPYELIICPYCGYIGENIVFIGYDD